jgi:hypothetical protein
MEALDCVINNVTNYGEENYEIGRNSVRLKNIIPIGGEGVEWVFFENGTWVMRKDGGIFTQGSWVCDGARDYKITNTLGEVYSSKIEVWLSTPKSDPKFYCVANAAYHAQGFKNAKKLRGQNSLTIMGKSYTWVFNADKTFLGKDGENADGANYGGTWKCLGNNTFEIIDKVFGEKYIDNGEGWTDINPAVDCVRKRMNDAGHEFDLLPDCIVKKNPSQGKYTYFYNNKVYLFMKKEGNNFVRKDIGTWECDGERHYKIFSKTYSNTFSSKTGEWTDGIPTSAPTEEPTYDKSKFPLKVGSRGPEVVQLQNYLNRLIPFEPLVVNGLFDKKTQDKLTQLQKSLNLIK